MFKVIFISLLVCIYNSQEECINSGNTLKCENVELSYITSTYSNIRDQIAELSVQSCSKLELGETEIQFPNLQTLTLSCSIAKLNSRSFENLRNLKQLNLNNNSISDIPNNLFQQFQWLETLKLRNNTLRNPTVDTFYYLNNLKYLDISYNKISNIDLGVLDVMKNLKILKAIRNGLFLLLLGVFDELTNLEILDLSYNNFYEIPLGLYDRSLKLIELNLEGNRFKGTIELGALDGLKNLQRLNLANSKLKHIPLGLFDQLPKLVSLDLSKNNFKNLTVGIFDELEQLVTLRLSKCLLNKVINGIFDKNKILENLDLSYNSIITLEDGTLDDTKKLKFLNISHNKINELPVKLFQQSSLEVVDLSFNRMETILPDLLNMENLREVYASNNKINYLDSTTFATNGNPLKVLDLRFNRLVFLEKEFFEWVANLERLDISGNPWDCKCLDDLLSILMTRFISYELRDYFEGKKPVCVAENRFQCSVDRNNLESYYNAYVGQ